MSDDLEDKMFDDVLADRQHQALLDLLKRVNASLRSRDAKDDELIRLIRMETSNLELFISKLGQLSAPVVKSPDVTVNTDNSAVIKSIQESAKVIGDVQKKTNELLDRLITLRLADVVLTPTREGYTQLIEKVTAKIILPS